MDVARENRRRSSSVTCTIASPTSSTILAISPIGSEALSVNTLDEVPDSAWFTNRHGVKRMSLDELRRGPNRGTGPDPKEKWFVFRGKSQGLTPGFQIKDGKGDRYVIKVDPVEIPEIASAAEIIATKIFYAIGYNVPENYIVYRPPGRNRNRARNHGGGSVRRQGTPHTVPLRQDDPQHSHPSRWNLETGGEQVHCRETPWSLSLQRNP